MIENMIKGTAKDMKTLSVFVFIVLIMVIPRSTFAQSPFDILQKFYEGGDLDDLTSGFTEDIVSTQNPLKFTYSPTTPKPGERVTISIVDYGRPVASSNVDWFIDGTLFSTGIGLKSISFNVEKIGEVKTVYAVITSMTGGVEKMAPIAIGASYIDTLWEAVDAKTPPFYKGKATPSWDTIIRMFVVSEIYNANGEKIPADTFVYKWEKNQSAIDLNEQSGYGKRSVYMLADFTRRWHSVGVNLINQKNGIVVSTSTAIGLHDPEMLMYEKNPLRGIIFEKALANETIQPRGNSTLRVVVYPLGLDARRDTDINYTWSLNGKHLNNTGLMSMGEIPLAVSDSVAGISNISVKAKNNDKVFQTVSGAVQINVE